ncbi:MAG: magnesium transporter [Youngiibacter sp.]|nr:magnesium transporter [Youngiibacter sp.]
MELKKLLLNVISDSDRTQLEEIFEENYAIDIADAMSELSDGELRSLINLINPDRLADVVEQSEDELQARFLSILLPIETVGIFGHMSSDDIADIIGLASIDKRKQILNLMKDRESKEIEVLLGYGPNTAGGIMTTQYIALSSSLTTLEALNKIKSIGPKTEVIETIFITNANNELAGIADLRDILVFPEKTLLSDIMNSNVISVNPETDQEDVAILVSKYDLKAIPVINRKNVLIGIITVDDIIDVIIDEQTEDLLMLSGVSKDEKVGSKFTVSVRRRLPWLLVNLVTAFMASFTVSLFEDVIQQVVALAAAMPIVAGMGGNAGSQTLSVVIRSIALGEVDLKEDWKFVFKEVGLGLFNGFVTGFLTGIILYARYRNIFLSLIIMAAMTGNLIIAGFFGFCIPLVLKRLKLDPALSSSVFLTTATDVFGFFLFLGLAKLFLPYMI